MNKLLQLWSRLGPQRQVIAVLSVVGILAAMFALTRMAATPTMTLLYAGLESSAAGEVVSALESRGVAYDVRGASIFVDARQRDPLRMTLASEGLPATGSKGYELLDGLSGFSTTAQMFDAAYLRAKEGELARTIMSGPGIRSARVHIGNVGSSPFQRNIAPTASVTVSTVTGAVTAAQAKGLSHLVASAVAGLTPENVAVIDAAGNLIGTSDDRAAAPVGEARAAALRDRVQRLLEAHVGFGNAVVEVSVETVTARESIIERRFDPDTRVAISTDTEERITTAEDAAAGAVTVASNLPDGAGAEGGGSNSQNSESRERVNYEVSEVTREVMRAPGDIRRLSVAVLVNDLAGTAEDGTPVLTPRPEAQLSALRELVASAVGYDEGRGDVITLKSMPFEPVVPLGTAAEPTLWQSLRLDLMSLIQMAVLALVALVLGLFVVRPLFSRAAAAPPAELALPPAAPATGARPQAETALTGEIDFDAPDMPGAPDPAALPDQGGGLVVPQPPAQDPVERLRTMIGERQEETVEILRSWLEDREEKA